MFIIIIIMFIVMCIGASLFIRLLVGRDEGRMR